MLKIINLKKNYGDFQLDLSMELPEGRITGLVGKNGAGKSTTIKAILSLIRPDSGSVQVFGKEASALPPADKERIGVALSDSGFSTYLTVMDVSKILSRSYRKFDRDAFLKKCAEHRLPENKQIKEFSTGMKAKLRVLVALAHEADLLILDEPTAGLDVEARNTILDILRNYLSGNERRSILITSHIATDLEGICDDIYLIHNGKIILHEDTDEILSRYGVIKVSADNYPKLDQEHLLKVKKEEYGYSCLTDARDFYMENYPELVIEKSGIDNLILMLTGGE